MPFNFKDLPYSHDALEPHIDAQTMEIHHGKHHKTYHTKMIEALADKPETEESIEAVLAKVGVLGGPMRNNAGGYYNHNLYWDSMSPNGGGNPSGALGEAVTAAFGNADTLRKQLTAAGIGRFGSGFAWLILKNNELKVVSTPNQDNPLMDVVDEAAQGTPLLGIDVWEHAYYLKYQNRRPDYLAAFWEVVNWDTVAARYDAAKT